MNKLLRTPIPATLQRIFAVPLIAGIVVLGVVAFRPSIDVDAIQSKARSALPAGSSREQVESWLNESGLPHQIIEGKGGEFYGYAVEIKYGSWAQPYQIFSMHFKFYPNSQLKEITTRRN